MKTIDVKSIAIDNKSQYKILIGLALFFMVMNLLNKAFYSSSGLDSQVIFSSLLFGLASAATYSALILIIDKPFIGLSVLCINYVATVIAYYILGDGQEALEENIIYALVVGVVLIVNYVSNKSKNSKTNLFTIERLCVKIPLPFKIILYSSMLTVIFLFTKTEQMNNFNTLGFKIYGATVVLIPFYFTFGILTTSVVAFEMFIVKILIEAVTFGMLTSGSKFNFIMLLEIIAEIMIAIYWYFRYWLKLENKKK